MVIINLQRIFNQAPLNSTNLIQPIKMYDMLRLCLSSNTITESPQHTKYIL